MLESFNVSSNSQPGNGGPPPGGGSPPEGGSLPNGSGGPGGGGAIPGSGVGTGNSTISESLRYFGASSYLVFTLFSLISNLLLLAVFIKGHKQFKSMAFFIIAWQMLICDFLGLATYMILHVPITFAGYDLYGEVFRYAIGFGATVSFNGSFFFVFLLTINRFFVFIFPKINQVLFTTPNIFVLITITWLFTCGFTAVYGVSGCMDTFNVEGYHLELVCSTNRTQISYLLQGFEMYMAMYIPIIMMAVYVFLFLEIRFRIIHIMTNCRRPTKVEKANRKEFFILIQSVLLCGVFELENVILSLMPTLRASLSNSDVVTVLSFSQAWINILGNTIHAIVIFFFNSLAREVFYVLIGRKKSISVNVSKATAVKVNASKAVTIKVQPAATRRQTVL